MGRLYKLWVGRRARTRGNVGVRLGRKGSSRCDLWGGMGVVTRKVTRVGIPGMG